MRRGTRRRRWIVGVAAAAVAIAAARRSVWPGALAIRFLFDRDTRRTRATLDWHDPEGVRTIANVAYRRGDRDARLDVHVPAQARAGERLPSIVWIHGGAWLSGDRADMAPYYRLLAAEGLAVVSIGYSLAPRSAYPTPVVQANDALAYLHRQGGPLHVDPERLVLAGDSAGAQIASQLAVAITDPGYAAALGVRPATTPAQLRGVILHCGIYDMGTLIERGRLAPIAFLRWGIRTMVWAYTGSRRPDPSQLREMSTIEHVSSAFPPTLVSGGNADPLTDAQSRPMAARLEGAGVDVTRLFFEADHAPRLGHEYQFDLETDAGRRALAQSVEFVRRVAG
jgi:acetyl esterase/lipase